MPCILAMGGVDPAAHVTRFPETEAALQGKVHSARITANLTVYCPVTLNLYVLELRQAWSQLTIDAALVVLQKEVAHLAAGYGADRVRVPTSDLARLCCEGQEVLGAELSPFRDPPP